MEEEVEECDDKEAGGKNCAVGTKLKASWGNLDGSSSILVFAEIFESFRNASKMLMENS